MFLITKCWFWTPKNKYKKELGYFGRIPGVVPIVYNASYNVFYFTRAGTV